MLVTSKQFERAPTDVYEGILIDVEDLGLKEDTFSDKTPKPFRQRLLLTWVLDAKDSEGKNFKVHKEVSATMGAKATLRKFVQGILGSDPGSSFELENLIGRQNRLSITTGPNSAGNVRTTIDSVLPSKVPFTAPAGYVRGQNKWAYGKPAAQTTTAVATEVEEESIPF